MRMLELIGGLIVAGVLGWGTVSLLDWLSGRRTVERIVIREKEPKFDEDSGLCKPKGDEEESKS